MKTLQFIPGMPRRYEIADVLRRDGAGRSSNSKKRLLRSLMVAAAVLVIAAVVLMLLSRLSIGCETTDAEKALEPVAEKPSLEEEWGIRILGIRQTAAGYMLDFRYRVVNAEKAAPLFDRKTKPYLVDQKSGAKFGVPNPPKVGPLRTSNRVLVDRNYFIFFANPGQFLKPGSKVTVVIGEFRAENLTLK